MVRYILKRVLQFIPVFIGVTILLFTLRSIVPGDPIRMIAGEKSLAPEVYEQIVERNHLNEPIYIQYGYYMNDLLHGDLGTSYQRHTEVSKIFADRFPYTLQLALCAIAIEIIIGIATGIISAIKRYSFIDVLVTLSTSILVSVPVFWLGMLLQMFFGIYLKDLTGGTFSLPLSGAGGPIVVPKLDALHFACYHLASVSLAFTARIMRSQLLEVLNQDYIRTAFAKGLSKRAVIIKHALKL